MALYTPKTTKLGLTQIIDRLNSENAALRTELTERDFDVANLKHELDIARRAIAARPPSPLAAASWTHGPRPAAPAEVRDTGFMARAETMRKVGAYLAGVFGRPATRVEVLAKIEELAAGK